MGDRGEIPGPVVAAWRAARSRWAGVEVEEDAYAAFVATRGDDVSVVGDDLYLACACARGDEVAIRLFEATFFDEIDAVLRKERKPELKDDLAQLVRTKLFVPRDDGVRAIASYGGRGPLRRWFRMTCARALINLSTRRPPEIPASDEFIADMLGGEADPELELIKSTYRRAFQAAFASCFEALEDRDKSLLRSTFREGLTVDALGALHGVHRSTVARWVVAAHQTLVKAIRARLMEELRMNPAEVDSLFQLVFSRMDITLGSRVG